MEEQRVTVSVFGTNAPAAVGGCDCGPGCCGTVRTMKEETEDLGQKLKDVFDDRVEVSFIDVTTGEMKNYPDVEKIIDQVKLPLTVINGQPRFHGGLSTDLIIKAIHEFNVTKG